MGKIAAAVLLAFACAGVSVAYAQAPSAKDAVGAVKQTEHDWIDVLKAGDADKLGQILADDWVGLGYDGKKATKQSILADVKSGKLKLESFEFAPMDVKVLGNVAVVQGGDTEKSTIGGKDTSGQWVWMDVFEKRDGKWVAVRSQSAKVK
jgi:ketosteroid isomerase-like protein